MRNVVITCEDEDLEFIQEALASSGIRDVADVTVLEVDE